MLRKTDGTLKPSFCMTLSTKFQIIRPTKALLYIASGDDETVKVTVTSPSKSGHEIDA